MFEEWKEYRLSDLINLIGGGTPKTTNPDYWSGSIPWLSVTDFNNGMKRIYDSEKKITVKGLKESNTKLLKKGQLIISARGTVGVIAQLGKDMAFNQSCYGIDAKNEFTNNDFLYYLLKHSVDNLKKMTHGAVFDTITKETFNYIQVKLPSSEEQKAIARILGSLDDKIELNRRMNKTLEDMARAIFKSWFVDFDPVKAKMEGRTPAGVPEEITDLFPDKLVESELGLIPERWEVGKIKDIATNKRQVIEPAALHQEKPYIGLEHIPKKSIALDDWGSVETVKSSKFKFNKGDILFGKLRPYFHKVGIAPVDGVCSTDILVLIPKSPLMYSLLLLNVSDSKFIEYTTKCSTGTKMPRTNWNDISKFDIILPPNDIVYSFEKSINSLFKRILVNIWESRLLGFLRNVLLPKLISGEIRMINYDECVGADYNG